MVDDSAKYEFKGAVTLRGMEAPTIAKWQTEGWELIAQKPGRVRMQLMFRRPKPKTTGEQLVAAWAAFRRLRPAAQTGIACAGGMVLAGLVAGIVAIAISESGPASGGGGGAVAAAATPAAAVAVTDEPTVEPMVVESTPKPGRILTKKNNDELAVLMASSGPEPEVVEAFAARYQGRTIAFNGNVSYVQNNDDYSEHSCDTSTAAGCGFLFTAGNFEAESAKGPYMQFEDADSIAGLRLSDPDVSRIAMGDNVRIVAVVDRYDSEHDKLYLSPVSTRLR